LANRTATDLAWADEWCRKADASAAGLEAAQRALAFLEAAEARLPVLLDGRERPQLVQDAIRGRAQRRQLAAARVSARATPRAAPDPLEWHETADPKNAQPGKLIR
jgi:hypothetical protein